MANSNGLPSVSFSSGLKGLRGIGGSRSSSRNSFFGTNSSGGFYSGGSFKVQKGFGAKPLTANQTLQKFYLSQQAKPSHSFLHNLFHGGVHAVEKGLDYISRPANAISVGALDAINAGQQGAGFEGRLGAMAHGLKTGIEGKQRAGMGQVLQAEGILKGHRTLRGIAGFGLDVTTDPVLLASLGTGAGEAELAARAAEMGVSKAVLKGANEAILKGTLKTADEAKNAADLMSKAGKGFEARTALAKTYQRELKLIENGTYDQRFGEKQLANLSGLQDIAQKEFEAGGPRMLQAQFKIPFGKLLVQPLPIKAPGLQRIADARGILGKFPGLPKAAETIGKAFKPGWRNEKAHALEVMSKRLSDLRQENMAHLVQRSLGEHANLSETEMRHALQWGETNPGIVKMRPGRADRTLNTGMLNGAVKAGELSQPQADFLRAWHDTTENLRKADKEFGVTYDKPLLKGASDNIIYVPHIRDATGAKFGRSALAKAGFQFERGGPQSQMALADKLASENPELAKTLVTNPLDLLARRASAGATKQSETYMRDLVASTFGHPTRVANVAKQIQISGKMTRLEDKLNSLHTLDNTELAELHKNALAQTEAERLDSLSKAQVAHAAKEASIKKSISTVKGQITKASKRKVPTATQLLAHSNEKASAYGRAFTKGGAPELTKALKAARATAKAGQSAERAVTASVRRTLDFAPVTGRSPHGSNFKAEIGNLLESVKGLIPNHAHQAMTETHLLQPFKRGESWEKRHQALVEDVLGTAKDQTQKAKTSLQDALDRRFTKQARKNLQQSLTARTRALEKHQASWTDIAAKIDQRSAVRLQNRLDAIEARKEKELVMGTRLRTALDKLDRQMEFHTTSLKNPEAYQPGFRVTRIRHANGSQVALPIEMADSLERAKAALRSEDFISEFRNVLAKNLARWKVWATAVNPGYATRNATSILWNSYISPKGGMPLWAWGRYGPQAAKILRQIAVAKAKDPATWTPEERQLMRMNSQLAHHGIYMGLFQGDVERVRRQLAGKPSSATQLIKEGHPLRGYARGMTTANIQRENWERLTHYLYRTEGQKLGPGEAAAIIRAAHFDYGDLTPTEQKLRRNLIPFYTWTRRNIPYQLSSLVQRPGKYAAFPLLRNESQYAAGPQPKGAIEPGFIANELGFRVPFGGKGNYYLPRIGPEDLMIPEHPIGRGLSSISPAISIPIELLTKRNLETGAPIYGPDVTHPRSPISGFAASILKNIPGTNVGPTSRFVNGKKVTGPGANPLVTFALQQTPLTNLLASGESNIKKAQRGGGNKALLSELTGVSTYKPDQQALQSAAQAQFQQGYKQFLRGLRDANLVPEAKRKKQSASTKSISKLANVAFGGK